MNKYKDESDNLLDLTTNPPLGEVFVEQSRKDRVGREINKWIYRLNPTPVVNNRLKR